MINRILVLITIGDKRQTPVDTFQFILISFRNLFPDKLIPRTDLPHFEIDKQENTWKKFLFFPSTDYFLMTLTLANRQNSLNINESSNE